MDREEAQRVAQTEPVILSWGEFENIMARLMDGGRNDLLVAGQLNMKHGISTARMRLMGMGPNLLKRKADATLMDKLWLEAVTAYGIAFDGTVPLIERADIKHRMAVLSGCIRMLQVLVDLDDKAIFKQVKFLHGRWTEDAAKAKAEDKVNGR
jgi:hypothetical protein